MAAAAGGKVVITEKSEPSEQDVSATAHEQVSAEKLEDEPELNISSLAAESKSAEADVTAPCKASMKAEVQVSVSFKASVMPQKIASITIGSSENAAFKCVTVAKHYWCPSDGAISSQTHFFKITTTRNQVCAQGILGTSSWEFDLQTTCYEPLGTDILHATVDGVDYIDSMNLKDKAGVMAVWGSVIEGTVVSTI